MTAPMTIVGYANANEGWTPPKRTKASWVLDLPPLYYTSADAQAEHAAYQCMAPGNPPKTTYKVTLTFEPIEDAS